MVSQNIVVEEVNWQLPENLEVELVERKGLGHPDYIADSASEEASLELSRYYEKNYGKILHHNLDKTLLVGGQARPVFGGGELLQPIYIVVSGRATTQIRTSHGVDEVPVGPLVLKAVKRWIRENFRFLDPEHHIIIDYKIGKGSVDLRGIFESSESIPRANDTSFGSGFYPLTTLERIVLETERTLNSREVKKQIPELGEDVKVMGLRTDKRIDLTIAGAIISQLVEDSDHYMNIKEKVVETVKKTVEKLTQSHEVHVYFNTGDIPEKNIFYLTVTGTSAEHGDDGATGRGNRANGLITPMRPMSLEATAGKNPVNHVGKIYNVLAMRASKRIYEELHGKAHVSIQILSQIGRPINEPLVASVKLNSFEGAITLDMKNTAKEIMREELENITKYTRMILEKRVSVF
jgi:S-adenosylmethionine synthetase